MAPKVGQPNKSRTVVTNRKATKKFLSRKQANALVIDSGEAIKEALEHLSRVRELAAKAGLSVECTTLPVTTGNQSSSLQTSDGITLVPATAAAPELGPTFTGGHSNTDHTIERTGDETQDRLAELRRNFWRRHRAMQPEQRGENRWDKPRLPGERRRRIVRDRDEEKAPPEPPNTGYVTFVGQMTAKIRHDRPNVPHDQTKVMQEISKMWRAGLSRAEREYYTQFSTDAKEEYKLQMIQYRATGSFTPSEEFAKLPGVNIWVHRKENQRNKLEREISGYSNYSFPKRPASMDEAYELREERSKLKRKLKLKGLYNEDGTLKNGLDFDTLFEQERQAKAGNIQSEDANADSVTG